MIIPNCNIASSSANFSLFSEPCANTASRFNAKSEQERQKITKMIMRLFDRWELSTADQLELLGLSANSRRMLTQYRKGKALPGTRDMQDRIGWMLMIHQDLRTLYPENPEICYGWIGLRNPRLNNASPLEIMKEQGLIGIFRIAQLLEHLVEM